MTFNTLSEEKTFNKKRGRRVSFIIISVFLLFVAVSLFSNAVVFGSIILVLLYDYFVLLGGNIHWLNRILDDREFNGTGIYRRMLAADAKMIILAMLSGLWIIFLSESQSHVANTMISMMDIMSMNLKNHELMPMIDAYIQNHISAYDYIKNFNTVISFRESIPRFVFIFFLKIFMLGQLTHSIHHILLNEKFTGMKFSGYAPSTAMFKNIIEWARRGDNGKRV